jgi:phosphohistidine phosphatase SixA
MSRYNLQPSRIGGAAPTRLRQRRDVLSLILVASGLAAGLLSTGLSRVAQAGSDPWRLLADGSHIALVRHANAPGTGDPPGFTLADCASQRNLDVPGRSQARRLGERFRAAGFPAARLFTSEWCRCRETAELMALGPVEVAPEALNSFFSAPHREAGARQAMLRLVASLPRTGPPVVFVTHQVNITAVTGIVPAPGEIVVARRQPDGSLALAGRIPPD